ncbi:unnamed protein product [Urochloa decumbens]|uniref:Leucine-rich repeat-containing N-terminal plant-type domain-containing protein n=1 Tax=Urochloa decumbens TaxID=240449 RepID=A0ABC9DBI1_9POAL
MPRFGPILVMLLSMISLAASCTEQERSSLLQFLTRLSQDNGLTNLWKNGTDCCTWEGIRCSPEGMVTDVSLASRNLQGFISPSVGNLTGLLRINLSGNLLSGDLPLELVSSRSIIVLDLSFNQLSGGLPDIPYSTPARPLQVMNISSNLFTGRFPSTIWEVMKSLVALNASNNSFIGQIPTAFCVSTSSIVVLDLGYNQFSGSIPPELGNCTMMKSLHAEHNKFSGTLPDEIFNIISLEHLFLHDNQFVGSLKGISNLTNLVTLDLGGNGISGNIPESIGELKKLKELHLDDNNMSGGLPTTLNKCKNLISIDLKSNNFSGELAKVNFSTLSNLKILDIGGNSFTGTVPESIYSCNNLTALRLSSNRFHGQLSKRIGNLKSLSFLSVADNSVTNITRALQMLRSCRNLTTLIIGWNFKNEAMPEGNTISGFENLQVLSINDCSLSGKIPLWLSKLTNLEILALYNNQLTGTIPDWINSLTFLFYIDISNNSLTGEIPTAIINMPMLETNKVAPKAFELSIYPSHRSLQYRELNAFPKVLNLGSNTLNGVIPEEIGQLKALISLNLSSNNLTGAIPLSICNITNLQLVDLSSNHLTGMLYGLTVSSRFLG